MAGERYVLRGSRVVRGAGHESDCTVVLGSAADCWALAHGQISVQQAFAKGQLSVRGSLSILMQLRPFVSELRARLPAELPGLVSRGFQAVGGRNQAVGGPNTRILTNGVHLRGVRWLPDSASNACMACDASFTMMRP